MGEQPRQTESAGTEHGGDAFEPTPDPYLVQQKPLPDAVHEKFESARQAMRAQDWPRAQTLLEEMTKNYPQLSGPFLNLGLVYRRQGQHDAAAQAFAQAIDANPINSEAYNQLAILHRERGEFAEAEQLYLRALEVWPHNPVIHRNLGILYDLYMGRFADALEHYRMSQKVASEPENRMSSWIVDLRRRLTEQQAAVK